MVSPFPAILIGGPPHRGKSCLSYILSKHMERRQLACYLLQANPDGEGCWFHEASPTMASALRVKKRWEASFEEALDEVLRRRPLPFLVDAGGKPSDSQQALFAHCTHAILLGANEGELDEWRAKVAPLPILAEVTSAPEGVDTLDGEGAPLRLTLSRLARGPNLLYLASPAWERLIEVAAAVLAWSEDQVWAHHWPACVASQLPVNLLHWRRQHALRHDHWTAEMLAPLCATLPPDRPLALFGRGPVWLAAAIALHNRAPLTVFDARYGWLALPALRPAAVGPWTCRVDCLAEGHAILRFTLTAAHLPYAATLAGPLPHLPTRVTVVLDGKLPIWLFAALARHYAAAGHTVAVALPRDEAALVIHGSALGERVPWRAVS